MKGSNVYNGVASVGTLQATITMYVVGIFAVIFSLIGFYVVLNSDNIRKDQEKRCKDQEKAKKDKKEKDTKKKNLECPPKGKPWVMGLIFIGVSALVMGAAYLNYTLTKKYKEYAAIHGVGVIADAFIT